MCWFRKKLPHPEEKPDYTQTLENINLSSIFQEWLNQWDVPMEFRDYWRVSIEINVTNEISHPAQAWEREGIRYIDIRPEYVVPGVIAHEQAHNSYALLSNKEMADFSVIYNMEKRIDPLIKFLYSKNTYGLTSDIEGHAEVYRYLGQSMPDSLKKYYPKLFRRGISYG